MTFLNPLVLIGLAAAAIPILLHLFSLRRLEKIEFSTLTFLKELQKTKIRRLKLRQLLLLFLRTLLVVLIVTAFSRPTLKTPFSGSTNSRAKTTAVIIIDNSYSMTSIDEQGQLLKQAKEQAAAIVRLFKEGDEIFVVTPSGIAAGLAVPTSGLRDFAIARAEIQSIEPSYIHATIEDALRFASRLISTSTNLNKEIYVLSDFKVGNLRDHSRKERDLGFFPDNTRFFFLRAGRSIRENLGIESVNIENALFGVGRPITIKSRIRNWGSQNQKNDVVSVFLNGTRVAQKAVDIPAQDWAETEFTLTPTSTGYLDGMVEIQGDDLEFDNRRPFAVYVPERLRILLVGNATDTRYLRLALIPQPVQDESIIALNEISSQKLSTNEIQAADVIVFVNIKELSSAQQSQIRMFTESGGGVVYFPGSQTDSSSFQSTWVRALQVPPISSIVKTQKQSGESGLVLDFDKIDFRHPVFQGMFEKERLRKEFSPLAQGDREPQVESPKIYSLVRYQTNIQSIPIITLSDGSSFMLEQKVKKGVVILFSVSATTDWSNFVLKGLFVPLIHSSTAYAAQQHTLPLEITVGQEADLILKNNDVSKVIVQNPDKTDVTSDVVSSSGESALRFRATTLPGIYSVKSGTTLLKQFVATLDPDESNTVRAGPRDIEALLRQLGIPDKAVRTVDRQTDVQEAIIQSRVGLELWKYFVAAALIIGLIESLVARTAKRDLSVDGIAQSSSPDVVSQNIG